MGYSGQLLGFELFQGSEATSEAEHQVKSGLLLNVVVRESSAILKLLASKDESLLVRGDTLLVLDLGLDVLNGIRRLNIEGDGLASESLHEDLHTTSEAKHQVESRLLLNVVVRESSAILELLAGEDKSLLIRGDALLVLDLSLHVLDSIAGLNIKSDSLTSEGLYEDLHTTSESEDQVKS